MGTATGDTEGERLVMRHEHLSADGAVQRTTLRGGWRVTVNFGTKPFTMGNGVSLLPMSFRRERLDGPESSVL
jgi:hypothetical protein